MKRAIFLDRDGVLNRNVWNPATGAYESPLTPEQFELLPNVIPALQLLQSCGFELFLVSNQPNHAKGKASMAILDAIHAEFLRSITFHNITFAACYYCFHHPAFTGICVCRKPSPYFLHQAQDTFDLDLAQSWMIGDRESDMACGQAAGTRTIQIGETAMPQRTANLRLPDLWSAANYIAANLRR